LLAVAGPVDNDRCVLTNSAWTIDAPELCAAFSFGKVHILNDFEATALSLPLLTAADLYPVGGGEAVLGAPMAVLGPGTGLGVACFVPGSQSSIVIASEGGHATMASTSAREDAIMDYLRRQFSHVSAERVVSGSGLENLYRAVIAIDGFEAPKRNAAEITNAALDGTCPISRAALDLFCAMLGTFAGNVALMFGARGGVFIAGGSPAAHRIYSTLGVSRPFRTQRAFQGISRIHSVKHHRTSGCDVHGLEVNCGTRRYDN